VTSSHFSTLLNAIQDVRSDLSSRLEKIDERLRDVEAFQVSRESVDKHRTDVGISVRWKVGIAVSAVGTVITIVLKILDLLGGKP
jgi:tetrahydromethanopterin S-methyltransferase subunit G